MELVALKIQITQQGGEYRYPAFNQITPAFRGNTDWTKYIDQYGGWLYDNCCDFNEIDEESPDVGVRIGVFCVPEEFAKEAIDLFPDLVSVIDETALEHFYDNRAMIRVPAEKIDEAVLNGLRAKYGQPTGALDTSVMTDEEKEMLDPESPRPGIVKNKKRKFADVKAAKQIEIKTLD